jgi:hypothetical protein
MSPKVRSNLPNSATICDVGSQSVCQYKYCVSERELKIKYINSVEPSEFVHTVDLCGQSRTA